jgi:hypothetical protein
MALAKKINPNVIYSRCPLHQPASAVKTLLPSCLQDMLDVVV